METVAFPRRSETTVGWMPAGKASVAWVWRRSWRRMSGNIASLTANGGYAKGFDDAAASINETDADAGTVKFETEGERLVKVSVELEYTPYSGGDQGRMSPVRRDAWIATCRSTAPSC
jgi:hypothetical protein